jgi:O-acetyl-ADP-ribose deacetylase (regulator of RNase III)
MLSAKSRGMDAAVKVGVVFVASLICLAAGCSGGYGGTRINDENSSVQPGPDRASEIDGNEPDARRRRLQGADHVNVITGDLLQLAIDGRFDVIVHGCNCQCAMGKGIALSIKEQFPEAYAADLATAKGDRGKLGTFSSAVIERPPARFTVVNAYTQFHWRGKPGEVLADYDAIRLAFAGIKRTFAGLRIGYPKIGAGLARGDWAVIANIIDEALVGEDHTLVEFAR